MGVKVQDDRHKHFLYRRNSYSAILIPNIRCEVRRSHFYQVASQSASRYHTGQHQMRPITLRYAGFSGVSVLHALGRKSHYGAFYDIMIAYSRAY